MKALVLGCGSIGLRHIEHLRQLGISEIEAADPDSSAQAMTRALGVEVHPSSEAALQRRPDVVLVCTPAATHVPMVEQALAAGAHVFVEKPLSTELSGTEDLIKKVQADGRVVQVGYNLRYHPAVREAIKILSGDALGKILTAHFEFGLYLPKWWKQKDYRTSYMANAASGGGLLFDGSHEIDLALLLMGPIRRVTALAGRLSNLEIKGSDAVKVLMETEAGALISVNLDCLQPTYSRGFTLLGEDSGLRWDCSTGRADDSLGQLLVCQRGSSQYEPVEVTGNPLETYLEELRAFLDSVQQAQPPQVPLQHGVDVLRVAEAIERSLKSGVAEKVSSSC